MTPNHIRAQRREMMRLVRFGGIAREPDQVFHCSSLRAMRIGLLGVMFVVQACATPSFTQPVSGDPERRLLSLERDFLSFTQRAVDIAAADIVAPEDFSLAGLDPWISELESLRLRYLQMVGPGGRDSHRLIALLRIAELHLDFGARIRRIPYPEMLDATQYAKFDEALSRAALPLEIVGLGVLEQIADYAARVPPMDGEVAHYVERCELYLTLHRGGPGRLAAKHLATLTRELTQRSDFPAPRTLLEAGRIGQRAAR